LFFFNYLCSVVKLKNIVMRDLKKLSKEELKKISRVTIKKLKTGFGHDLGGYYCDVYLDNKKVGYVNDDGWGGPVDVTYENDDVKLNFETYLTSIGVAEIMYNKFGWDFYESVDKIDLSSQGIAVVEIAIDIKEIAKAEKKINKLCLSNIVYGTPTNYSYIGWKKVTLAVIVAHPKLGVKALQELYNETKSKLKDGEVIFNKNLEELGIVL